MNKNNVKILTDWSKFNYNEAWKNVYEKYYTVLKSEAEKKKINTASYNLKKFIISLMKCLKTWKKFAVEIHKAAMCADYISKD